MSICERANEFVNFNLATCLIDNMRLFIGFICCLVGLSFGLQSARAIKLNELRDLLVTKLPGLQIEFGLVDRLIDTWFQAQYDPEQEFNPELLTGLEDLEQIREVSLFECENLDNLKNRFEFERKFGQEYVNLHPQLRYLNKLQFARCIWSLDSQLDDLWDGVDDDTREFLEDVHENTIEMRYANRGLREAVQLYNEIEDIKKIDSKEIGLTEFENDHDLIQWRRWYISSAAFFLYDNQQLAESIISLDKENFKRTYYRLLVEPCQRFWAPFEGSKEYVQFLNEMRSEYLIDTNERWVKFEAICTFLADKSEDYEAVYNYYIAKFPERSSIAPSISSAIKPDFESILVRAVFIRSESEAIKGTLWQANMSTDMCMLRPTLTQRLLKVALDNYPDELPVEVRDNNKLPRKERLMSLKRISSFQLADCSPEHFRDLLSLKFWFSPSSVGYGNLLRYINWISKRQRELCERRLRGLLNEVLNEVKPKRLFQLESLRRLYSAVNPNSAISSHRFINRAHLNHAVATYLYLNHQSNSLIDFEQTMDDFQVSMCQSFYAASQSHQLHSMDGSVLNAQFLNVKMTNELSDIAKHLLTYGQLCARIISGSYDYGRVYEYIRDKLRQRFTSFNDIELFLEISNQ